MARYRMDDNTIVNTDDATEAWEERRDCDGRNPIGRSSGSQWHSQALFRSRKGRYYIEYSSAYESARPHAEWVSPEEACRWLLLNARELPADLVAYAEDVAE